MLSEYESGPGLVDILADIVPVSERDEETWPSPSAAKAIASSLLFAP